MTDRIIGREVVNRGWNFYTVEPVEVAESIENIKENEFYVFDNYELKDTSKTAQIHSAAEVLNIPAQNEKAARVTVHNAFLQLENVRVMGYKVCRT